MNTTPLTVQSALGLDEAAPSLAQRVARIEARQAIEDLKYRYFRACDAKAPELFRACFVKEGADLDYGALGKFATPEDLVAVFQQFALNKVDGRYVLYDMHHGLHPHIEFRSDTEAVGAWTLRFRQVNLAAGTETVICGEYDDRYVVEDGAWKLQKHHFNPLWTFTKPLPEGFVLEDKFG